MDLLSHCLPAPILGSAPSLNSQRKANQVWFGLVSNSVSSYQSKQLSVFDIGSRKKKLSKAPSASHQDSIGPCRAVTKVLVVPVVELLVDATAAGTFPLYSDRQCRYIPRLAITQPPSDQY